MSCKVMLPTQISAILNVLVKAAVTEICDVIEQETAGLHHEIQKRNDEIQKRNDEIQKRNDEIQDLKSRLMMMSESKVQSLSVDRSSVAVQVQIMDSSCSQEKTIMNASEENLSEEKPHFSHIVRKEEMTSSENLRGPSEDEDLSGLEFEMKIEQVEELVDQKLNNIHSLSNSEGQNHYEQAADDTNSHLWSSGGHLESPMEPEHQSFTDSYVSQVSMEEQMTTGFFGSGMMLESESLGTLANKDIEYSLNLLTRQDSHRHSPTPPGTGPNNSEVFSRFPSAHSSSCLPKTFPHNVYVEEHPRRNMRPKPFRCEECGKGFTQKTRLITHRRVHTGEKPFRCQLCGKTFSRQDNCLRHVRLHSGQR